MHVKLRNYNNILSILPSDDVSIGLLPREATLSYFLRYVAGLAFMGNVKRKSGELFKCMFIQRILQLCRDLEYKYIYIFILIKCHLEKEG